MSAFEDFFECDVPKHHVRKYKIEQKLYDKRENMSIL